MEKVYRLVEYTVRPETMIPPVEKAMKEFAAAVRNQFPNCLWLTTKKEGEEGHYFTLIVAPDEEIEQKLLESEASVKFAEILRANTHEEPRWTSLQITARSHDVP